MPGIQPFRIVSPDTSQEVREQVDVLRDRKNAGEVLGEQALLSVTIVPIDRDVPHVDTTQQQDLDIRFVRALDLNDGTMIVDGEIDGPDDKTIHFVVESDGSRPAEGQMVVD